jgi:glyoxylase-like metal-dependent hydrolase (beta-lactamase superfamily II)
VAKLVEHGEQAAGFTFYHTPGHAPDELTIQKGGVLFAGDHILPEITPHPTIKSSVPDTVRNNLPEWHRDEDKLYGLDVYLRSLMLIGGMGEETLVMPAHRLINRGKLNVLTAARAREIADHHIERVEVILEIMGTSSWSLGDLTKKLFAHRRLNNVYEAALHETMAHVELLIRCGDVLNTPENRFVGTGTQNYLDFLSGPASQAVNSSSP